METWLICIVIILIIIIILIIAFPLRPELIFICYAIKDFFVWCNSKRLERKQKRRIRKSQKILMRRAKREEKIERKMMGKINLLDDEEDEAKTAWGKEIWLDEEDEEEEIEDDVAVEDIKTEEETKEEKEEEQ